MTHHGHVGEELPFLVNGTLGLEQRRRVESHLRFCSACQAELSLWQDVAAGVRADAGALAAASHGAWQRVAARPPARAVHRLDLMAALVAAQVRLVRHGLWQSSALVMVVGFAAAWVAGRGAIISVFAPLVAAAGVSQLYGPQHDPAFEIAEATATSPRHVLLARLFLVFGYDLVLALAASAGLAAALPDTLLAALIGSWLAPMTFLSGLALVCSIFTRSQVAMGVAFGLWLIKSFIGASAFPLRVLSWAAAYRAWWEQSTLLLALAAALWAGAIWLAGRRDHALVSAM